MRGVFAIGLSAACSFHQGAALGDGRVSGDTGNSDSDSGSDAPSGPCFGGTPYAVCVTAPTSSLTIGTTVIQTDPGQCKSISGQSVVGEVVPQSGGGPELCVIAATSLTVNGTVSARGALPLVLLAGDGDLHIAGNIDVSSHGASTIGAGGNDSHCAVSPAGGDGDGAGGGAGGSFGTAGGNGGIGEASGSPAGGTAPPASGTPSFLRGGCAGGNGGNGTNPVGAGGVAGAGGGALSLIAMGTLTIASQIDASGGYGAGAVVVTTSSKAAGGGGGSGGMIVLYGKTGLTLAGTLFANGGGGGGGGDDVSGGNGGESMSPGMAATGGPGGPADGRPGGNGAVGTQLGATGMGPGGGGGGGGGGVGVIRVVSGQAIGGPDVSPPAS